MTGALSRKPRPGRQPRNTAELYLDTQTGKLRIAKADGTDVAIEDTQAILTRLGSAKGTVLVSLGASRWGVLAVGADGLALIADSTATSGLAWGGSWDAAIAATVQTTDATVTTCGTYTLADQKACHVSVKVVALQTATNGAGYVLEATFRRNGANVTQVGATTLVIADEDVGLALGTATLDASGTSIRVRVTGVAATTISWRARGTVVLAP